MFDPKKILTEGEGTVLADATKGSGQVCLSLSRTLKST